MLGPRRCAGIGPMLAQESHRELIHDLAVARQAPATVTAGAEGATVALALLRCFGYH